MKNEFKCRYETFVSLISPSGRALAIWEKDLARSRVFQFVSRCNFSREREQTSANSETEFWGLAASQTKSPILIKYSPYLPSPFPRFPLLLKSSISSCIQSENPIFSASFQIRFRLVRLPSLKKASPRVPSLANKSRTGSNSDTDVAEERLSRVPQWETWRKSSREGGSGSSFRCLWRVVLGIGGIRTSAEGEVVLLSITSCTCPALLLGSLKRPGWNL